MIPPGAVQIAKLFQPHCNVDGCGWLGDVTDSYQEANDARFEHLDQHRAEE
jgi:hypothetical protein